MATIIEEYENNDCYYELGLDRLGYFVRCWTKEGDLHWYMRGKVIEDDGTRQKMQPYVTEADARVEFDRWRR